LTALPTRPTSIDELRRVAQPPEVRSRANAEHWTASLYLRDVSPYLTWWLLKTSISANGVTGLMILTGWATAAALLVPGIGGAMLALVLGQLQMLVDCCDGEVARWRGSSSPAGVFLDKVGHYSTEALIPVVLGVRAAGWPFDAPADYLWTTLGLALALVIVLNKALNDMVHVARAAAGLTRLEDKKGGVTVPSGRLLSRLRSAR
jgi:phosphatidylglycerophosphate synthase